MRLLIVEDDPSFLLELELFLLRYPTSNILAKSIDEALVVIDQNRVDLIILDLMLFGSIENGKIIAKRAAKSNIPFLILTSIREESVYDSFFDFKPLGYLTKPIDKLALKYIIESHQKLLDDSMDTDGGLLVSDNTLYTFVKKRKSLIKINYDDIITIKADGNYLTISTDSDKFVVRYTLAGFIEKVKLRQFIQVRRNYVINVDLVQSVSTDFSELLIAGERVPIGRKYRSTLKDKISHII